MQITRPTDAEFSLAISHGEDEIREVEKCRENLLSKLDSEQIETFNSFIWPTLFPQKDGAISNEIARFDVDFASSGLIPTFGTLGFARQ